jgi:hypothetical protein
MDSAFQPSTNMDSSETILVGHIHSFRLLEKSGRAGLFEKRYGDGSDRVVYIVAALSSSLRSPPEFVSSALEEFTDRGQALEAFRRWQADPLQVRRVSRKKGTPADLKQGELDLEF